MNKLRDTILIVLVSLLIFPYVYSYAENTYRISETILYVYEDGSVQVSYLIEVTNPPENISVKLLGSAFYIQCLADGTPIPVDVNGLTASFTAISEKINLTYITNDLTSKSGDEWTLKYSLDRSSLVILPEDAFVYSIEPKNFDISIINSKAAIALPAGNVVINYVLYPGVKPSPPPSPNPVLGLLKPVSMGLLILIGVVIVVIAGLIMFFARKRGGSSPGIIEALDERDRTILNILKDHGELTAKDIMNISGIPKTPLYRRLNKLRDAKLIEAVKREGVIYYRIRK